MGIKIDVCKGSVIFKSEGFYLMIYVPWLGLITIIINMFDLQCNSLLFYVIHVSY